MATAVPESTKKSQVVLPVIVLYNCTLLCSSTYKSLEPQITSLGAEFTLSVYDNSPSVQRANLRPQFTIDYCHDRANSGLAVAYNRALKFAIKENIPWLLLLDQDSVLPSNFYSELEKSLARAGENNDIVAVVPRLWSSKGLVSPIQTRKRGLAQPDRLIAVNSCTTIRVSFMTSLNGFNTDYPLDYLDHWLFHNISKKHRKVLVIPVDVRHDLSVADYRNNVSVERYRSILSSESRFVFCEKRGAAALLYAPRLLSRAIKQLLLYRCPRIALLTLSAIPNAIVMLVPMLLWKRSRRQ